MVKKHMRKSQQNPNGAIIDREGSIHISNVKKADEKKPEAAAV
jgi:large subunit ribosomal protein L24